MAHGLAREGWWRDTRRIDGFRAKRAQAAAQLGDWMRRCTGQALAINGPREWVAIRAWNHALSDPYTVRGILRVAECYEFERHGPAWGRVVGGVMHSPSGMLSAVARYMIVRGGYEEQVMFPRRTYPALRKMAALALGPMQPWLLEYGFHAAKRWRYLARKAWEFEAERNRAAAALAETQTPPSP